ncbi:MAG: hypothetical protein ABWY00_16505 [Dongiaceae bacterium]
MNEPPPEEPRPEELQQAYDSGMNAGWAWCNDGCDFFKDNPSPYPKGKLNDKWEQGYLDALDFWYHAQNAD